MRFFKYYTPLLIFLELGCSKTETISAKEFIDEIKNSIVFISAKGIEEKTKDVVIYYGSGFVITEDGYIATADHIFWGLVDNMPHEIIVTLPNEGESEAELVFFSKKEDIAFLKIDDYAPPLKPLKLSTTIPEKYDPIVITGYYHKTFFYSVGVFVGSRINKDMKNSLDTNHLREYSPYEDYTSYGFFFKGESGGALIDINQHAIGLNILYYKGNVRRGGVVSVPASTIIDLFKDKIRLDIGY